MLATQPHAHLVSNVCLEVVIRQWGRARELRLGDVEGVILTALATIT
jgi:hypothetical protein